MSKLRCPVLSLTLTSPVNSPLAKRMKSFVICHRGKVMVRWS